VEIEKLQKDLINFENDTKISIKNIHREKDTHILEKESSDKKLNELQIELERVNKELIEKIDNHQYKNKEYETKTDQLNQSIIEKNIEIEKLKIALDTFEKESKINIENIHKEKDNHILENQLLDKKVNEL